MKRTIGVLGGSGQIGKRCIAILKQKNYSILATYNNNYVPDDINCKYLKLNVHDTESLSEFVKKCDVILNCAGASYINGENIARVANNQGIPYIDPSGESFLEDKLEDISNKGVFILSAGYFPGLTGLLLEYVANQFDKPLSIEGFNITNEVPSYSAIEDFILTNLSGFGKSLCSYLDGKIVNNNCKKDQIYRDKSYKMYNYLTNEIVRVADKYKLKQANWYNCSFSDDILSKMQEIVYKVQNDNYQDYKENIEDIINFFKKEVGDSETFSYLEIYGKGIKNNKLTSITARVDSEVSSEMSAIVMTYTAIKKLEKNLENDIYYAMDIVDLKDVIKDIDKLNINLNISEYNEYEYYDKGEI